MPSNKLKPKPKHSFSFEAIGTKWSIDVYGKFSEDIKQKLIDRIEEFDHNYSRFRNDSLVSKMSEKAGTYNLPADAEVMIDLYQKLYKITQGQITPLVGNLISDAGYDKNYSFKSKTVHAPGRWEDTLEYKIGTLKIVKPVLLDFGAIGKGYLVDILADLLERQGINTFCIDASGDLLCKNLAYPEIIGLEHPDAIGSVIGTIEIQSGALCGSAVNRRTWQKYHHIMNPRTLRSQDGIKAVWVQAATTAVADGLSTALFFCEARKLLQHFDFDYALIRSDNSLEYSPNFAGRFFD